MTVAAHAVALANLQGVRRMNANRATLSDSTSTSTATRPGVSARR
jgi:hypothetical protein